MKNLTILLTGALFAVLAVAVACADQNARPAPHQPAPAVAPAPSPASRAVASPAPTVPIETPIEMRSYTVPKGQAHEVRRMLSAALKWNHTLARISVAPDGKLLVVTRPELQKGIAEFLAQLGPSIPQRTRAAVDMTYWVVVGTPAAETAHGAALAEVAPALSAIAESQGAQQFQLLERVRLRSVQDERARAEGRFVKVSQTVRSDDEDLRAQVTVERIDSSIQTQIRIEPGQLLVIGETGYERPGQPGQSDPRAVPEGPQPSLYYIVRGVVVGDDQ